MQDFEHRRQLPTLLDAFSALSRFRTTFVVSILLVWVLICTYALLRPGQFRESAQLVIGHAGKINQETERLEHALIEPLDLVKKRIAHRFPVQSQDMWQERSKVYVVSLREGAIPGTLNIQVAGPTKEAAQQMLREILSEVVEAHDKILANIIAGQKEALEELRHEFSYLEKFRQSADARLLIDNKQGSDLSLFITDRQAGYLEYKTELRRRDGLLKASLQYGMSPSIKGAATSSFNSFSSWSRLASIFGGLVIATIIGALIALAAEFATTLRSKARGVCE